MIARWSWWRVLAAYLVFGPLLGAVIFSFVVTLPDLRRPEADLGGVIRGAYLFFLFVGLLFSYAGGSAAAILAGLAHIFLSRIAIHGVRATFGVSATAAIAQCLFLVMISKSRTFDDAALLFMPMAAIAAALLNQLIQWREAVRHNRSVNADVFAAGVARL